MSEGGSASQFMLLPSELECQNKHCMVIVGPDDIKDPFCVAVQLMSVSDLHKGWTVSDLCRLLVPPLKLGQCVFVVKEGKTIAFVSWALFSKELSMVFSNQIRPLCEEDWQSGDQPWVIDFIGTFGSVIDIVRMLKQYLVQRYPNYKSVSAIRYEHGRVRRLSRWTK